MLAKRQQCYSCKHNVYSSERVEANGRIFHQGCLKCEDCGVALKPKGLKKLNGAYYCKEHHQKNLFAPRPQKQAEDDASKQVAVDSKKKSGSSDVPVSDDGSTQSSSSKERSISFSEVVEVSSGITVSGTFMTVSGLGAKKSKKAAKKQSKDLEKQQSGSMRKRSASFTGIKSGIANLVSSGSGKFKTRSKNDDHAEQDKIVEFVTDDDNVEVENADIDADADDDETDEKKLALQKKIEEMKKRNEEWMKRIANEIGKKKDDSESEASDSDIDTSDITFTTERDATEMSEGDSDTELMSDTSDIESDDDDAEMQRMLREREEELKRKREEIKRKEEEMKRKLEEMKRKEEEVLRKEEELQKKEEERLKRKREAQQRKKVKLAARNGTKPGGEDEELQQIEEEMRKQEEHLKKVEEEIRLKEARIKEKERRMLLEGSGSAEVAVVASTTEDSSNTEAPITDDEKKQKRDMWMKEIDEEVERRRKDKKASQGADADAKVAAPKKRKTSGEPSRRKLELLALLDDSADAPREETAPSSDDSQEESGGQEMRDELVARCTYVWALDKQKKEEEEKKKRQEDDKDSAQRELDEEQQRRDALKKKEAERERKQKEEEWERMQQRVEEELRLEEAKKRAEEERRLREQTLKRRNEAWFRKMEEEMAAREETLRQLREAEEKRRTAENDERKAMGLPPLADSSDSNTSSYASGSDIKGGDDSDRSVDVVVALAAAPAMGNLALKRKPVIPRKPLPPTPVMERERKPGSDLINELAARRAKSTSWDSTAGDVIKASVIAAGPIVQERRSSVDSGTAAAKKASGTRRVSDVSAALELADRKAASKDKRQSLEGVAGKASKKPFLLLRPAIALRPKDKKAKKQMKDMKDMEKIMKKRKQLQKKGANAPVNEERPQCLYGDACKSLDPDHWVVFQHTPLEKREEEEKRKAEKAARRLAKGKERVSTDEDEDAAEREREEEEKRERRLAAQRKGEQSSDSVRALEEEMLKNVDSQDEEAWKAMRKQLARERERKMELAEIEREKTALMTERKRIEFEMSSIRAERKQIEEESRSRIDVRSREKQQERESNNRGRVAKPVQPKQRQVHVAERNNFYKQKLQNIKEKQVSPQKSAAARSPQQKARANAAKNGVARVKPADGRKQGTKKLPAVPRSTSSSSPSAPSASPVSKSSPSAKPSSPSAKASSPSSPLKSLPSGPRSRKEVMKLRESEMVANTKFMAKALQSYKSTDKKHLSFPRGASVRVLVVNEEDGMFYGCCNKKVGWFPSYYVKAE